MFSALRKLARRFDYWRHRDEMERVLREEMAFHAEMSGRTLGNRTMQIEDSSGVWIAPWLETFVQDIRFGLRAMKRNPLFSLVAIAGLALGIGVNTAAFTALDALAFRPLPVRDSERVRKVNAIERDGGRTQFFTLETYRQLTGESTAWEGFVAFGWTMGAFSAPELGLPAGRVEGLTVSGNLFPLLGTKPALGRFLTPADAASGAEPAIVLSHRFWQRKLASNPTAVGARVMLGRKPVTIVGVTPADFAIHIDLPDYFAPLPPESAAAGQLRVFGKLRPGYDDGAAAAELDVMAARMLAERARNDQRPIRLHAWNAGFQGEPGELTVVALAVFAMVGLVLAIACANLTNLLLARGETRRREIAIRLSVGAGRARLVRQLVTESVMLTLAGGAAGLLVGVWSVDLFVAWLLDFAPDMTGGFYWQPGVNWRILLFTAAIACATGILFGLAPALTASRQDLGAVMKDDAQAAATGRGPRLRKGLVVAQLAACTVLLTVCGVLVGFLSDERSFAASLGSESMIETYLPLSDAGIAGPVARTTQDAILARVRRVPGVRSASLSDGLPGGGVSSLVRPRNIEGVPRRASIVRGGPDWLETAGIRIERGRSFEPGETGVAVLDRDLADALWPGEDPIGKQVYIDQGKQVAAVVGVTRGAGTKNAAMHWLTRRVLLPLADDNRPDNLFLMVQTAGDAKTSAAAVQAAVSAMIPDAPLQFRTMADLFGSVLSPARLLFTGGAILAAIALILSAIGIYGVTAYTASRRTREIGIRMALGARAWEIVRLTMAQGSRLVALGVGIGMTLSIGAARVVTAQTGEFGVEWTLYAGVAAILGAIAMLAIFIPARKAAGIDPLNALRKD